MGKSNHIVQFGRKGDIPVPADYFGEGTPRLAVYRPSQGKWIIKGAGLSDWDSSTNNLYIDIGKAGDIPIPFDFFCEGKPRLAVYRPSEGKFLIKAAGIIPWVLPDPSPSLLLSLFFLSSSSPLPLLLPLPFTFPFPAPPHHLLVLPFPFPTHPQNLTPGNLEIKIGRTGDVPVPANFFNEEQPRLAVFRPETGTWLIKGPGILDWDNSEGNLEIQFGQAGDVPAPVRLPLDLLASSSLPLV